MSEVTWLPGIINSIRVYSKRYILFLGLRRLILLKEFLFLMEMVTPIA